MTRTVVTVYLAVAVAVTCAAVWVQTRAPADRGLHLSVSQIDAFDGRLLLQRLAPDLDLAFVDRDPSLPRRYFRVRWDGYWLVDRDRFVGVEAGADDRVTVRVDDQVVVDRHLAAGVDVALRQVPVAAGAHRLTIDYEQHGGGYSLEVRRALDGGPMERFDPGALFPELPAAGAVDARHRERLLARAAAILWIPAAGWLALALAARAGRAWRVTRSLTARPDAAASVALGAVLALGAGLLLVAASSGPDYGRYADWANAYLYQDLALIRTPVGSPLGLPLTQWAHGPGLIFSTARIGLGPAIDVNTGAMVLGWLAGLVFWWSFVRILRWAAGGQAALAAFGVVAAFVGTHAGFYSHHHASESLSLALVGVLALAVIERPDGRAGRSALVGAAAGLLLITRSNLAIYAAPALLWQAWQIRSRWRTAGTGALASALCLTAPVAIAAAQVAVVNRWMTGSFTRSPYTFGDGVFRSLDWANPEFAAVLLHPWHGLLPYHPLYAVGTAALLLMLVAARSARARLLCLAALVPIAANVYTQAAWYVWWMGTDTFGSRGLTVISIPLMAAAIRFIALAHERRPLHGRILVGLVAGCGAWSYLMLRQGTSQFLTYAELFDGQRRTLELVFASPLPLLLALLPVVLGIVWLWSRRTAAPDLVLQAATAVLGLLAFSYLFLPWLQRSWFATGRLLLPAALLLLAIWVLGELAGRLRGSTSDSLVRVGVIGTFAATTIVFGALAAGTERRLAAGVPARDFETTATIHTPEVVASYGEYQRVPGFEDKKQALAVYLGIDR
jgi:hypothetical protein